jgi:hypothetical protein
VETCPVIAESGEHSGAGQCLEQADTEAFEQHPDDAIITSFPGLGGPLVDRPTAGGPDHGTAHAQPVLLPAGFCDVSPESQRVVGVLELLVAGMLSLPLAAYMLDDQGTENCSVPVQLLVMAVIGAGVTFALLALARVGAPTGRRALTGGVGAARVVRRRAYILTPSQRFTRRLIGTTQTSPPRQAGSGIGPHADYATRDRESAAKRAVSSDVLSLQRPTAPNPHQRGEWLIRATPPRQACQAGLAENP